jgi:anti-sigma regulatory factor (Ser/Thr protein kinase)
MDSFVVPAKLDSLSVIRDRVNEASTAAGLTTDAAYKLALAIDEIATNIILHGYEEHGLSGDVTVQIEQTDAELIVTLEDTAPEYDPRGHKMPDAADLNKPLEDREIGGLGVYLALEGVDRFDYEYKGNRNRNIFAMKRR